eukprot:16439816-Heterocapsa_arctica.AAC.1
MDQQIVGGNHGAGKLPGEQNEDTDQTNLGGETRRNQPVVDKHHSSAHIDQITNTNEEDNYPPESDKELNSDSMKVRPKRRSGNKKFHKATTQQTADKQHR